MCFGQCLKIQLTHKIILHILRPQKSNALSIKLGIDWFSGLPAIAFALPENSRGTKTYSFRPHINFGLDDDYLGNFRRSLVGNLGLRMYLNVSPGDYVIRFFPNLPLLIYERNKRANEY